MSMLVSSPNVDSFIICISPTYFPKEPNGEVNLEMLKQKLTDAGHSFVVVDPAGKISPKNSRFKNKAAPQENLDAT